MKKILIIVAAFIAIKLGGLLLAALAGLFLVGNVDAAYNVGFIIGVVNHIISIIGVAVLVVNLYPKKD